MTAAVGLVLATACPVFAQRLSFSTDFDGRGTGGSISISKVQPSSHTYSTDSGTRTATSPSSSNSSSRSSGGAHPGSSAASSSPTYYPPSSSSSGPPRNSDAAYYEYEYQRYLQQQREAEERRRLLEEIERERERKVELGRLQGMLDQLDFLDGVDADHRYQLKYDVINRLVPDFNAQEQQVMRDRSSLLERLAARLDRTYVPPPPRPRHYSSVFVGGLFYTPSEAARDKELGLNDPFTGKRFDQTLGFGSDTLVDLARVTTDHLLLNLNAATEQMLGGDVGAQLNKLKGSSVDELVCHSNGCAVAQALIARGFIKARTLRIMGGDAAIMNLDALHALHESTGVTISVYAVVGDPVPLVPTGWQIIEIMKKIGQPLQSFESAASLTYEALGLKARSGFTAGAPIEVQLLTAPVSGEPWGQRHARNTYFGIITAQRMMGTRLADGRMDPAAMNR